MMRISSAGIVVLLLAIASSGVTAKAPRGRERPNVLLVVVDDMGYSDLRAFEGDTRTPSLDSQARPASAGETCNKEVMMH
jgi:arylsulfatase